MARIRNQGKYDDARSKLLEAGLRLIRSDSFNGVGINDVLKESNAPRGSFYHYFESKEAFGLAVAEYYHAQQMTAAQEILTDTSIPPLERLYAFFQNACDDYAKRDFADGCLMCNLSTELGDTNHAFQTLLGAQWTELATVISNCLAQMNLSDIGLESLSNNEAADWLLNAWSGALTRMKADRNDTPLRLFQKTIFKRKT